MTTYVGVTQLTKLVPGDRFRVTWDVVLIPLLGIVIVDAPYASRQVREALPSLGFIPYSLPSAVDADKVVVYDVRVALEWGTSHTIADMDARLARPIPTLTLARIEKLSATTQPGAGQETAISSGNAEQDAAGIVDKMLAGLKKLLERAATGAGIAVAVVVLGAAIYWYAKRER